MFALIGLEEGVAKRRDLSLLRGTGNYCNWVIL